MLSRPAEFPRRALRWLLPSALLALAPKCVLCVIAYVGIGGGALGLGGPEICGASSNPADAWATSLAWLGGTGAVGLIVSLVAARSERGVCCDGSGPG